MTPTPDERTEFPNDPDRRLVIGGILRTAVGGLMVGGGLLGCETTPRSTARPMPDLPTATPIDIPTRTPVPPLAPASPTLPGVLARSQWTKALPNIRNMNKQSPLQRITIHHDGLKKPLASTRTDDAKKRLESIRLAHVDPAGEQKMADIGYHFAIDRAGNVWECRPLEWEGAHVKSRNPGNIGILVMGNFEIETPTSGQLRALSTHVRMLAMTYGIGLGFPSVKSHCEWPGAATVCPGKYLQPKFEALRNNGFRV